MLKLWEIQMFDQVMMGVVNEAAVNESGTNTIAGGLGQNMPLVQ